jgi:hypothetical protein
MQYLQKLTNFLIYYLGAIYIMSYSSAVSQFFQFLRDDLGLSEESLTLVKKYAQNEENLPMLLWKYGLISLVQLNLIFDWLEQKSFSV